MTSLTRPPIPETKETSLISTLITIQTFITTEIYLLDNENFTAAFCAALFVSRVPFVVYRVSWPRVALFSSAAAGGGGGGGNCGGGSGDSEGRREEVIVVIVVQLSRTVVWLVSVESRNGTSYFITITTEMCKPPNVRNKMNKYTVV